MSEIAEKNARRGAKRKFRPRPDVKNNGSQPRVTAAGTKARVEYAFAERAKGRSYASIALDLGRTEGALIRSLKIAGVYPIPLSKPTKSLFERAHEKYSYDPDTGEFVHKLPPLKGRKAGAICNGYMSMSVDGQSLQAHRLAWLMYYGALPTKHIDHINRIKNDNRIANLREADQSVNIQNTAPKSRSGLKGVTFDERTQRFAVRVSHRGRTHWVGFFSTARDAALAYDAAAVERFGIGALTNEKLGLISTGADNAQ